MLEAQDIVDYTTGKQDLQIIIEKLFDEMMAQFYLPAFLADPRGYTRAFLAAGAANALKAVVPDAYKLGRDLASKAAG